MTEINGSGTRAIVEMPFGIACYEGAVVDGMFKGRHVGVCGSWEEAKAWLRDGSRPASMLTVYSAKKP